MPRITKEIQETLIAMLWSRKKNTAIYTHSHTFKKKTGLSEKG